MFPTSPGAHPNIDRVIIPQYLAETNSKWISLQVIVTQIWDITSTSTSWRCLFPVLSFCTLSSPGLGTVRCAWKWAKTRWIDWVERFIHIPICSASRNFESCMMAHCMSGVVWWPCGMATVLFRVLDQSTKGNTYCAPSPGTPKSRNFRIQVFPHRSSRRVCT